MDIILAALLMGTLSTVAYLLIERLQLRTQRISTEILIHRGLQAQIAEQQRLGLLAPETPRPVSWQGDGAGATETKPSVREQTALESYRPGVAASNGFTVRGHIKRRTLIEMTCGRCGADLLPDLEAVLVRGACACTGRPALKVVA